MPSGARSSGKAPGRFKARLLSRVIGAIFPFCGYFWRVGSSRQTLSPAITVQTRSVPTAGGGLPPRAPRTKHPGRPGPGARGRGRVQAASRATRPGTMEASAMAVTGRCAPAPARTHLVSAATSPSAPPGSGSPPGWPRGKGPSGSNPRPRARAPEAPARHRPVGPAAAVRAPGRLQAPRAPGCSSRATRGAGRVLDCMQPSRRSGSTRAQRHAGHRQGRCAGGLGASARRTKGVAATHVGTPGSGRRLFEGQHGMFLELNMASRSPGPQITPHHVHTTQSTA